MDYKSIYSILQQYYILILLTTIIFYVEQEDQMRFYGHRYRIMNLVYFI